MTNDGSPGNALAERLNHLFETVHPAYTAREVADAINAQAGVEIIENTRRLEGLDHFKVL